MVQRGSANTVVRPKRAQTAEHGTVQQQYHNRASGKGCTTDAEGLHRELILIGSDCWLLVLAMEASASADTLEELGDGASLFEISGVFVLFIVVIYLRERQACAYLLGRPILPEEKFDIRRRASREKEAVGAWQEGDR